jgi:hypothetical protein
MGTLTPRMAGNSPLLLALGVLFVSTLWPMGSTSMTWAAGTA